MDNDKANEEAVATAVPVTTAEPMDNGISSDGVYSGSSESKVSTNGGGSKEGDDILANKETGFAALAFASIMILIQTSHDCEDDNTDCDGELAFGVAMAVVSLFVLLIHFLVYFVPAVKAMVPGWDNFIEPFLVVSLFVWNLIGVFVLTFKEHDADADAAPFNALGTGWLGCWSSLAITTVLLYPSMGPAWTSIEEKCPMFKSMGATNGHEFIYIIALTITSFIVLIEASDECAARDDNDQDCDGKYLWAVLVSLISFIYALVLLLAGSCIDKSFPICLKYSSLCLPIWWFFGVCVICVDGPFETAANANGFLGSYAAFGFSCILGLEYHGVIGDKKQKQDEGF